MVSTVSVKIFGQTPISVGGQAVLPGLVTRGSKNPLWEGFAYRLSSVRVEAGLPALTVNTTAGLAKDTANRLEDRKNIPTIETVERLAVALGVSPCWLAYGHEGPSVFKQKRPKREPLPEPIARLGAGEYFALHTGIGKRLRARREEIGFSVRALSRQAAVSPQQVLNTEAGTTVPKIDSVERLALALDVAPCWLAYGAGGD